MERIEVLKTYKLYIGGQFPRTESGRYYTPEGKNGKALGNICQGSRKDFRNSVTAARKALSGGGGWKKRDAFNRSQILYRIGEMLEGRRAQFEDELKLQGSTASAARKEVEATNAFTTLDGAISTSRHFPQSTQSPAPTSISQFTKPSESSQPSLLRTHLSPDYSAPSSRSLPEEIAVLSSPPKANRSARSHSLKHSPPQISLEVLSTSSQETAPSFFPT